MEMSVRYGVTRHVELLLSRDGEHLIYFVHEKSRFGWLNVATPVGHIETSLTSIHTADSAASHSKFYSLFNSNRKGKLSR